MPRSLASRFFVASIIILPIVLALFAFSLDAAFRRSLLSGEEERLKTHSFLLLGAANVLDGVLLMPGEFREQRFNQLNSGLYGVVHNESGQELWRSHSAQLIELDNQLALKIQPGETRFYALESRDTPLFCFDYDVIWEGEEQGKDQNLRFTVLHYQAELMAEQQAYRQQLWQSLGLIGLLILASQMAILHWGLRPLRRLAKDLVLVESGQASALSGNYPREIQAVTDNLNQVLASERQQRQRYRNTLDDLAHSLKTPLSVIKGSILTEDKNNVVTEQVERMNQIISHQLQRAVVASPGVPGKAVNIRTISERLITSLNKVYREKKIDVAINIDQSITFPGDERDLMEVLGNLIENAYKYGFRKITISAKQTPMDIEMSIEDDGKGIAAESRQTILQRGARADTVTSGQGIGLAVAVDIISSYQGSLRIEESCLGGAKFVLTLPIRNK